MKFKVPKKKMQFFGSANNKKKTTTMTIIITVIIVTGLQLCFFPKDHDPHDRSYILDSND